MAIGRRRKILLLIVASATGFAAAGLGAATLVKSPQQVAAEAGPPEASVISAVVERRVLTETVVLRGTVAPGKSIDVTPAAAESGKSVITRSVVKRGQRIKAGAVVAEVSGRPVLALLGKIPAYRDIRPGLKGPDVAQLQNALRDVGYSVGDAKGTYGASTQAAVKRLYEGRGYEAPVEAAEPDGGDGDGGAGEREKPKPKPKPKVYLKAGEVVFVPKFPARVTEVKAGLGAEVKGSVVKLATGDLVVRGSLSPIDRKLVKVGKHVRILVEERGLEALGRVASIGEFDGGNGRSQGEGADEAQGADAGSEPGHPIVVEGLEPLGERFAGQDVRLTIEAASTGGRVLVVPASAIYASADGTTQVVKVLAGGKQERVPVRTGATGGGFVEVTADGLSEGDRVVVGK